MSIQYVRSFYDVPAKRGMRVRYSGGKQPQFGTITGADEARLRVRMDGEKRSRLYHPTWKIKYLTTPGAIANATKEE